MKKYTKVTLFVNILQNNKFPSVRQFRKSFKIKYGASWLLQKCVVGYKIGLRGKKKKQRLVTFNIQLKDSNIYKSLPVLFQRYPADVQGQDFLGTG